MGADVSEGKRSSVVRTCHRRRREAAGRDLAAVVILPPEQMATPCPAQPPFESSPCHQPCRPRRSEPPRRLAGRPPPGPVRRLDTAGQPRGRRELPFPGNPAGALEERHEPLLRVRPARVGGRRGPLGVPAGGQGRALGGPRQPGRRDQHGLQRALARAVARRTLPVLRDESPWRPGGLRHLGGVAGPRPR